MSSGNFPIRFSDVGDPKWCVCVCVLAVGPGPLLAAKDKDVIRAEPLAVIHDPQVHGTTGPNGACL